ncbi:rhodanese-like domain-containing protein [Protaetiibacter sp. SSC-01]|uniref:rhodanese-like domain-containing protein n=1 Tax=Protaetiibacter sp. SSC-01 TaxID=2759943 RepID=UPI001656DEFA|nr:rhodanese-like domain-containing protein [Protaetiibacter sp. SSC-01]QNO38335.1 rhodanese-like domain-containing protein [Protaetiibacter sp. SSC-01]
MNSIEPAELAAIEGAVIIDVRQPEEYDAAHVEGVTLVPLGELVERMGELPTDGTLYLMCRSGARSAQATAYLEQQGYDAVNVDGGIISWHEAGLPIVQAD